MADQIYRLMLDDYSSPSFVSFSKPYYGTLGDFSAFAKALQFDKECAKFCEDLIVCFDKFFNGEKDIEHIVAYSKVPFLVRAKFLGSSECKLKNYKWEHTNTWGFPYYIKCKEVNSTHIWLSCRGDYSRCIRADFVNLKYKNAKEEYDDFTMIWGLPHQIEIEGNRTHSRLFVIEKHFKTKADTLLDMENFKKGEVPDFSKVMDDIFGDG